MPLINNSTYKPHFLFQFGHLNTILSNSLRKVKRPEYKRVRIDTDDLDFLDLDLSIVESDSLLIVSHGLEGSTDRDYMRSIVNHANENNWDAIAWNMRGCSGELNKLYSSYHSGKSDDLDLVVNYALANFKHKNIYLLGFSLGGNVTLKYLGERGSELHPNIRSAAALSVPVELKDSAYHLAKKSNWVYMQRFIKKFQPKLREKLSRFPENNISEKDIQNLKSFYDFDSLYTAPAHGFKSAEEYWQRSSSIYYLANIQIPTLLINSIDDPFLAASSYPYKEAMDNPMFYLETPKHGGHVGFTTSLLEKGPFWYEKRMLSFLEEANN